MISFRKADLLDVVHSQQFPQVLVGKKLIYFPAAFQEKMNYVILGWQDGMILRNNDKYGQDPNTASNLFGANVTDKQVYTPSIYTEANFFGVRDGFAFFKNNQQNVDGREVSLIDKNQKTPLGKIVGLSDGLVHTESGTDIYPEKVTTSYSSSVPGSPITCRVVR